MSILAILVIGATVLSIWYALVGCVYAGFFPCGVVDGKYFSYKPNELEVTYHIKRIEIFARNCFRYLIGIERPVLPLHIFFLVFISAIAQYGVLFMVVLYALKTIGYINMNSLL